MQEFTQTIGTAPIQNPQISKTIWWLISRFALIMLVLIAVTWDFLLGYTTLIGFDVNIQDFGRFYFATQAFINGQDMYGPTQGTLIPMTPLYAEHLWDLNPPHFHLLFYPLIVFSPHQALAIWASISILAFFFCCYLVISELRISLSLYHWGIVLLAILAFSATGFLIRTAQVSLILMLPFTLAWLSARKGNWSKSGFYLGVLTGIKLFFLIFLPLFLFRRQFRGIATFLLGCLSGFGLGLVVFGVEPYLSWMQVLTHIDWAGGSNNASLFGFMTRAFSDSPFFQPINAHFNFYPTWFVLSALLGLVSVLATAYDSSPNAIDRGFSILSVGAILISPLGWSYYFFLPLGPIAALAYSWKNAGFIQRTQFQLRSLSLRNAFLILGIPGLFFPCTFGTIFQPNTMATLFIASIYFWTTLFIWAALLSDWHINKKV